MACSIFKYANNSMSILGVKTRRILLMFGAKYNKTTPLDEVVLESKSLFVE